jgi:serine/threonine protein kinase/predicted ATPase
LTRLEIVKPERWQQIESLCHDTLDRKPDERARFLDAACGGDADLRREVESLLKYARATDDPLDRATGEAVVDLAGHLMKGRFPAGTTVGVYRIETILAAGGMGVVYRARDTRLNRPVAIKFLSDELANAGARRRFQREAQMASALNHPHIVTVHDAGEFEGRQYLVTEFVDGGTLKEWSQTQSRTWRQIVELLIGVADGLAAAHAAGILHRDIKPANILVGTNGYAKLADFGIAKLAEGAAEDMTHVTEDGTSTGMVLGTIAYMSPEQASGRPIDARSDVFSFGLVLYEMLAGRKPFEGTSGLDSMMGASLPLALRAALRRALEQDPAKRHQQMRDFVLDLRSVARQGVDTAATIVAPTSHTVGRTEERAELHAGFASAVSGRGLLLCVSGEPGIGKTTLVEQFLSELTTSMSHCLIARGRCSERLAGTSSYLPWLDALEAMLRAENVAQTMKQLAPTWYAEVSAVEPFHTQKVERSFSPERMKRELAAFLQHVSRSQPIVIFFDDVHWADVSTMDLLAYVAGRFTEMRVLVVAAYRPSDLLLGKHPFLQFKPDLQARGVCHEIQLGFLSREDVERYLALEFPDNAFADNLSRLIHTKTEGSPLFMADLVRYLRDRRVVARNHERWTLVGSLEQIERDLPESVRAMIERKIAQLGEDDRRFLAAASVQGHEFDSAVVARVLKLNALEVEDRLEALERVHAFVRQVEEREFPDHTPTLRYRFVHVLYQNALYSSLRPARKASVSAAVAEALLGYVGTQHSAIAAELAMLFETARDFARAGDYFLLAAQNAARISAYQEAVMLARRGLEAVKMLPDSAESAQQELLLQMTLGPALMVTRGWASAEVEATYKRARELCRRVGGIPQLFPVIWGLYQFSLSAGDYQTALQLGRNLLDTAEKAGDSALLLQAHNSLSNTFFLLGEWEVARMHGEHAIAIYTPSQHHSLAFVYNGADPGVLCRTYMAVILWNLGYPEQAFQESQEAVRLGRELSHSHSLGGALIFGAVVHQHRRDSLTTFRHTETFLTLGAEHGFGPPQIAWGRLLQGWALADLGEAERGVAQMLEALAVWKSAGLGCLQPYYLVLLAEAQIRMAQVEAALVTLAEALTVTERTHEGYVEAEIHRLKGELLLLRPIQEEQDAEACFRQAIEIARRQHARCPELRAVMSLCRLYRQQGKPAEAYAMLAELYGWFTEGFDTRDLKEARELLAELNQEV